MIGKKGERKWPWLAVSIISFFGPSLYVACVGIWNPLSDPLVAACPGMFILAGIVLSMFALAKWLRKMRAEPIRLDLDK